VLAIGHALTSKALQNWKIFVKALSKPLWKLTKLTKGLIAIILQL